MIYVILNTSYDILPLMPKLREIIGHESVRTSLAQDLKQDNVSHAYLLAGPPHIGKMTVARDFASQLLLHGQPPEKHDRIVREIEHLTHPDLFVLDKLWIEGESDNWETLAKFSNVPQVHRSKKPAAKTDVISIDDIRALQERLHETGSGQYRCCIIRSVERMQDAAANAFLKTLEEPPPGLVFLLTTQSISSLLPTILSRTRLLRMSRLSRAELRPLLENVSDDEAHFVLMIAQGAPGAARQLLHDPDLLRDHRLAHGQAETFWKSASLEERLRILTPLHKRTVEGDRLLLHLALALRGKVALVGKTQAFHRFTRGLSTNAHRQLLAQRFILEIA